MRAHTRTPHGLDGVMHFNWQFAASSFPPEFFNRRNGGDGVADRAVFLVVFLADVLLEQSYYPICDPK